MTLYSLDDGRGVVGEGHVAIAATAAVLTREGTLCCSTSRALGPVETAPGISVAGLYTAPAAGRHGTAEKSRKNGLGEWKKCR